MEIIYRASDGTEFSDKKECKLYEKNLEKKTKRVYETYNKNLQKKVSEIYKNNLEKIAAEKKTNQVFETYEKNLKKKVSVIYKNNLEKIAAEKDLEKRARRNMDSSISLQCTSCGKYDTRVIEYSTQPTKSLFFIRRKRECLKCSNRLLTYEINLDEFRKYDTKELYDLVRDKNQKNSVYRFCLSCGECDSRVLQSRKRIFSANYFVERVRECLSCSQRFSTLELKLEKNFTLKKIAIPVKYYASDLKEFNNEDERNLYEKNLEKKENLEKIKENPEVTNYLNKAIRSSMKGYLIKNQKKNYKKDSIDCYKKAIDYLQKAIELDDKNPDLYCRIGDEKIRLEEYKEAIDYYQKAIELGDKELGFCNYQIGFCKFFLKKYQEAIVYFLQAIILNFDHSKCCIRIGICKDRLKKYQEAIDYYQKAIELNYEDPSLCIYEIGSCMCFLRKYKEAIDYYQKAIELNHKNPSLCKSMIKKMHYYIRNRI